MLNRIILTSEERDQVKLQEVKDVLKSIPGIFFSFEPKKKLDKPFIEWTHGDVPVKNDFFDSMNEFRDQDNLDSSDYLIFLTSRKIPGGYFNGIQFDKKNIFIDLENWERLSFERTTDQYPIAFHVWISVLINHYFEQDEAKAIAALHRVDKGCILDFNGSKEKVDLKIQTARICSDCLNTFLQLKSDPNLLAYFRSGIEQIRQDFINVLYNKKIAPKPVPVYLKEAVHKRMNYRLEFEGLGFLELDASHLTLYLLFLRKLNSYKKSLGNSNPNEGDKENLIRLQDIGLDYYLLLELYKTFTISEEEDEVKIQDLLNEVEKLKKQKIVLPGVPPKKGKEVTLHEAALKVKNKLIIDSNFKKEPKVKAAVEVIKELEKLQNLEEKTKNKKVKNEKSISKLCQLEIENDQFIEFKNNDLNLGMTKINKNLSEFLGTFGLHEFYSIEDRGNGKYGVSPEIEFKDLTGLIKSIDAKIEKFDPIKIIQKKKKSENSDPL
jgi:hypothetical protein